MVLLFPGKEVAFLFSILLQICRDLIVQLISKKMFDVRQSVNSNGGWGAGKFKKDSALSQKTSLCSKWAGIGKAIFRVLNVFSRDSQAQSCKFPVYCTGDRKLLYPSARVPSPTSSAPCDIYGTVPSVFCLTSMHNLGCWWNSSCRPQQ